MNMTGKRHDAPVHGTGNFKHILQTGLPPGVEPEDITDPGAKALREVRSREHMSTHYHDDPQLEEPLDDDGVEARDLQSPDDPRRRVTGPGRTRYENDPLLADELDDDGAEFR